MRPITREFSTTPTMTWLTQNLIVNAPRTNDTSTPFFILIPFPSIFAAANEQRGNCERQQALATMQSRVCLRLLNDDLKPHVQQHSPGVIFRLEVLALST